MIIFDLKCLRQGHVFEAWFASTVDYEAQKERGLVTCPLCGGAEVEKAVMAPNLNPKANRGSPASSLSSKPPVDPEALKQILFAAAAAQKDLLASSEHVGDRFADEARSIHFGETDARAIHGRATLAEAESLVEDGIPISALPFPVIEPGQEN